MFIQTEETPNPNAIKFLPNMVINAKEPIHFSDSKEAEGKSNLALQLFKVKHVKWVFLGKDFITITKDEQGDWLILKPEILMTIMDYFVAGNDVFEEQKQDIVSSHFLDGNEEDRSEIEKQIIEIIETRIRPSVAQDGGDIVYKSFEDGIVKLELRGACHGCPSSMVTLKNGIEKMLQHFIPEVKYVEAIN